jgi:hypothetical protein
LSVSGKIRHQRAINADSRNRLQSPVVEGDMVACEWGEPDETYERKCTAEEAATLEADGARAKAAERAEEEELRNQWLALLRADLVELADESLEPVGKRLVDPEGDLAEQPADRVAPHVAR